MRPILREIPKRVLAEAMAIHPRKVVAIRNGHARPQPAHVVALVQVAAAHARLGLDLLGRPVPMDAVEACGAYLSAGGG